MLPQLGLYDFDIAAIAIYLVIFIYYFQKRHIYNAHFVMYVGLLFCAFLSPLIHIETFLVAATGPGPRTMIFWHGLYMMLCQLTSFFLMFYILSQLDMFEKLRRIWQLLILSPVIFMVIEILFNGMNGFIFSYAADGQTLIKGPLYTLTSFAPLLYYIWILVYVNIRRTHYNRTLYRFLHVVCLVNMVPEILRYFVPSLDFCGLVFALSTLFLTINMDRFDLVLDSQTGLAPRRYLDDIVKRYMLNHIPFDTILIRVADYDLLIANYGVDRVEKLMIEIGKFLFGYARNGLGFQVDNHTYALIVLQNPDINWLAKNIYDRVRRNWSINDIEIASEFYVTTLEFPDKIPNMENFTAYLQYFQGMQRRHYGLFTMEELKVNDKVRENQVERAIERAIRDHNLLLYYQPICTTEDCHFVSAEALVRIDDPELGLLNPSEFIPIAEDNGSIIQIGNYIIDSVCKFITTHDIDALGLSFIELNLSMVQCLQSDFIANMDEIVDRYRVLSKYLCFEITETASNYSPAVFAENITRLADRGFALALDDFGTGYSNLLRMANTHYHVVKFDKEMTQKFTQEKHLDGALEKLISMIHSMGSHVVCEGVESLQQYEYVKKVGGDYIQGYYFSKPLPEKDFVEFLKNHNKADE